MVVSIRSVRGRRVRVAVALRAIALITFSLAGCRSHGLLPQRVLEAPTTRSDQNESHATPADSSRASLSVPPAPPVGAYLGGIPPAVFAQLKDLPLMAPSFIPEGFRLVEHGVPEQGYYLIYRSETDQCFAVEYASKGSSSVLDSSTLDSMFVSNPLNTQLFNSPVFGSNQKLFYGKAPQQTEDSLMSQWLHSKEGAYRYLSGAVVTQNYPAQLYCADVSLESSVSIITSLASLTAEPTDSIGPGLAPSSDPVTAPSMGSENLSVDPEKQ